MFEIVLVELFLFTVAFVASTVNVTVGGEVGRVVLPIIGMGGIGRVVEEKPGLPLTVIVLPFTAVTLPTTAGRPITGGLEPIILYGALTADGLGDGESAKAGTAKAKLPTIITALAVGTKRFFFIHLF
jgi:hypothetical protein